MSESSRSGVADWIGIDLSAAELAEAARRGRGPLVRVVGATADPLPAHAVSAAAGSRWTTQGPR
ncbi:hypothetical protein ACGRHY_02515 [Streptomyces sp. HK10]|uniref:hypothetical protein n=1 Tax=Streptomyces sp. HK10 TaxID=3373255 RepID=UPI00374A5161